MSEHEIELLFELNQRAGQLFQQGAFEEALEYAERALELGRRLLDPDDPQLAMLMRNAAQANLKNGRLKRAEALAAEALEHLEEHLGPYDLQVGLALNDLAGIWYEQGRLSEAAPGFERAAEILRQECGEEDADYAQTIHNLAALYGDMGDYARAIPLSEEAVELRGRLLGEDDSFYASSLANLGGLHFESGNFERAMELFEMAAAIVRRAEGEEHSAFALCLQHQGGYFHETGAFDRALPLLQRSLEIWRSTQPADHPDIAKGLHNLAGLYLDIGNYEKAEPLYLEALAIRRKQLGDAHRETANTLNSLAGLYDHMGRMQEVEGLFRESMEIRLASVGDEHPDYAQSLHNLAGYYKDIGDFDAAEPLYREAARIYRRVWGDHHPNLATVLNGLAVLHRTLGDTQSAESCHREALKIRHACFGEDHPAVADSVANLAVVLASTGRISEALSLKKWALSIENRLLEQIFAVSSEGQRRAHLDTLRGSTYLFASLVLAESGDCDARAELLDLLLRRKGIEAEALAVQRSAVLARRHPQLREKLRTLDTLRAQIARKQIEGPGGESLSSHQVVLSEWLERKERLEEDLVRDAPEIRREYRFLSTDRSIVARTLPQDAALVEFLQFQVFDFKKTGDDRWAPARYLALVLIPDEPDDVKLVDLGDADVIDSLVTGFRRDIVQLGTKRDIEICEDGEGGDLAVSESARELRARVFDPLLVAIGSRRRLIIAPDGQLNILPFEALPLDDERYVIDEFSISYVSSGRDLLRWGIRSDRTASEPVVVANPDFDLAETEQRQSQLRDSGSLSDRVQSEFRSATIARFSPLPGTGAEALSVSKIVDAQTVWLGQEALDRSVKQVRSPRFLHIATHGLFFKDRRFDPGQDSDTGMRSMRAEMGELSVAGMGNPLLRSCLALAGANSWLNERPLPPEAEDGVLTAEEVTGMDLTDTDLAVLSACETGLGDIRTGEGVYGLRRAFVLAGARTLVMSLWKVPDKETQELMEDFYGHLLAGVGCADALRQAQLRLKARTPRPFFWGAFICQGDASPVIARK